MKTIFTLAALALTTTMIACGPQGPQTVKGQILDASMNVLVITTNTADTLAFSTTDATIESTNGILIGDSTEITYNAPMSKEKNILTPATSVKVTSAPRPVANIVGRWVQPIPGIDGVQGIEFMEDGTAASINMATLVYKTWVMDGENLTMKGQSIGNKQTIDFEECATVEMPTSDSLLITIMGESYMYSRQK